MPEKKISDMTIATILDQDDEIEVRRGADNLRISPSLFGGRPYILVAAANYARLYADDSGGKTRLMVRFASGAAQQVAIEP